MKINVPNVCGEEKTSSSFGIPNKAVYKKGQWPN